MMKLLGAALCVVAVAMPGLMRDVVGLGGVGLVSYGAWMIYPPAGFITAGILLIVGTLLLALGNRAAGCWGDCSAPWRPACGAAS